MGVLIISAVDGIFEEEEEILAKLGELIYLRDILGWELWREVEGAGLGSDNYEIGRMVADEVIDYLDDLWSYDERELEEVILYDFDELKSMVLGRVVMEEVKEWCLNRGVDFSEGYSRLDEIAGYLGSEFIRWDREKYEVYVGERYKEMIKGELQ